VCCFGWSGGRGCEYARRVFYGPFLTTFGLNLTLTSMLFYALVAVVLLRCWR
jgi:hypothetical protein